MARGKGTGGHGYQEPARAAYHSGFLKNPNATQAAMKGDADIRKNLRAEYSRLRTIANKRINRMGQSEWKTSQAYLQNVGKYKELKDIKSPSELAHLLADVTRFVEAKGSSAAGLNKIRRETIKTLHERGYKFVNKSNYKQFAEFMDDFREKHLDRVYDSGEVIEEVFERAKNTKTAIKKAFDDWIDSH